MKLSLEDEKNPSDLGHEPAKTQSQLQEPKQQDTPLARPPTLRNPPEYMRLLVTQHTTM